MNERSANEWGGRRVGGLTRGRSTPPSLISGHRARPRTSERSECRLAKRTSHLGLIILITRRYQPTYLFISLTSTVLLFTTMSFTYICLSMAFFCHMGIQRFPWISMVTTAYK